MKAMIVLVVGGILLSGAPGWAQTPPTHTTMVSHKLEGTGWVMIVVGGFMLLPNGTTYHVLGDDVCMSEYAVDYDACRVSSLQTKVGLTALGVGAAFALIGSRRTAIAPTRKGMCVSEYAVDYGACRVSPLQTKVALTAIGVATAFAFIGSRKIAIAPAPRGIGATVRVKW